MHLAGFSGDEAKRGSPQGRSGHGGRAGPARLHSSFPIQEPIILILLFAVGLSFFLKDVTNAFIILAIVLASGLLGFWQEYGAADAVEKLLAIIQTKAAVCGMGRRWRSPLKRSSRAILWC